MEWQGDGGFITRASMCCHSKNFFIATPILSLNMLAPFCSPFFHYLSAQGSVLEYRKHATALLLLLECNVVKLDDFVKKYDAKKT